MGGVVAGSVVAVALVLLAVDRMVARGWFDRRRPRERPSGEGVGASGMLGDFIEVFQPNRVHLTAEQERQKLDIHQTGDAAPPLDLDSGVVRIDPR
ncbi:DUF6191 domain-containing protein [Cellulomonas sp. P5_C6]